jgi:hypothetical protein
MAAPRPLLGIATAMLAAILTVASAACSKTVGEGDPDVDAARRFERHPLLWVGERFEGWELERIDLHAAEFVTFSYGTCELEVPADGGCAVPLQIQVQPLCTHLRTVARNPIWRRREIRGAPVGTIDGAPVLFTDRVQVKVYRGQGADAGVPLRAIRALRSVNEVPPVVGRGDAIPAPPGAVLAGREPCRA